MKHQAEIIAALSPRALLDATVIQISNFTPSHVSLIFP
jgi:hypothetical protein